MRHRNSKATLNRPADHRKAMMRNLMTSLFLFGKVKTTDAKAKELSRVAEKLITRVKKNDDMNAIRALKEVIFTEESSRKALEYARKTSKTSGFTRATKVGFRDGDSACLIQIDLINEDK